MKMSNQQEIVKNNQVDLQKLPNRTFRNIKIMKIKN